MTRLQLRALIASVAVLMLASFTRADIIVTADGETISGHEATVVDGMIQVPGEGGAEPRKWNLVDLQRVTFGAARPTGELKTRFVRIELPGDNKMLHMGELQVFVGDQNVATGGKATQSSVWEDKDPNFGAHKCIDGNAGGDSRQHGTNHTKMESNPWWEVDLQKSVNVSKVVIVNRTDDNCGPRIAGFKLILLDEARSTLWTKTFPEAPTAPLEIPVPARGDAFSEADIKAFDQQAQSGGGGLLGSLAGWLSGKKPDTPAAAPAGVPVVAAARTGRLRGRTVTANAQQNPGADIPDGARVFQIASGGKLIGRLQGWNDQGVTVVFSVGGQEVTQTIPASLIREITSKEVVAKQTTVDRKQASLESDTVYAKTEGGAVQAVAGVIKGLEGESLNFEFKGKLRKILLSKVVLILRAQGDADSNETYAAIDLKGGQRVPGRLKSLVDGKAVIETQWKGTIEAPRNALVELSVRNGRVTSLADLEPTTVEHVPFLDRKLPHTVNHSLNGQPLQVGDAKFDRGLCTHSRTVLTYDLGSKYKRLRAMIGLQKGDGDLGKVLVRVHSDNKVIFEKPLNGGVPAESLDIDVAGKKTLVLEVDYGDDMDIGDHVVWGEPVLVSAAGG